MAEKILCFEMLNFRALNTLTSYLNISKIRVLIQITLCRNARIQMDLSKNNCFSAEEAKIIFLAPRKERRYQYMKCLSSLGLCPPPWFQFYHRNWRRIRFLHHLSWSCFVNTKWLPLSQRLSKRLKLNEVNIYMFKVKDKGTRTRCEIYPELTIKAPRQR